MRMKVCKIYSKFFQVIDINKASKVLEAYREACNMGEVSFDQEPEWEKIEEEGVIRVELFSDDSLPKISELTIFMFVFINVFEDLCFKFNFGSDVKISVVYKVYSEGTISKRVEVFNY